MADGHPYGMPAPILKQSSEKRPTMRINATRGYTFFEILVVLVVVSIILAIIISRFSGTDVELSAQSEVLKTHLRFAQATAMSTDTVWGLHCDNASTYWLFRDGNIANRIHLPAEDNNSIDLGAQGFSLEAFTLAFDSWGIPYTDAGATAGQELTGASVEADITLTRSGNSKTIRITPNTGFVP
jgi:MSHA pilin protein MshC